MNQNQNHEKKMPALREKAQLKPLEKCLRGHSWSGGSGEEKKCLLLQVIFSPWPILYAD
jgi:hypothetical protein